MGNQTDLIDRTNHLLAQLRLIEMAASAVEDRDDRNALQLGLAAALEMLHGIKAGLTGPPFEERD